MKKHMQMSQLDVLRGEHILMQQRERLDIRLSAKGTGTRESSAQLTFLLSSISAQTWH